MRPLFILFLFTAIGRVSAQQADSTKNSWDPSFANSKASPPVQQTNVRRPIRMKTLVVPLSLITYGVISQTNEDLKEFDVGIKDVVRKDGDFHTPVDNYLQYAPGFAVYALNAVGIKGQHNFRDRTLIYLLSNIMMGITVQSIKKITKVVRPDGGGTNAFPSGHTATAFAGAEFLRQEYKDVSPWYGIAGYAAATTTGILRMYNNKHWFRDVVAGAGFGILFTELAYRLEPVIANKIFRKKAQPHIALAGF